MGWFRSRWVRLLRILVACSEFPPTLSGYARIASRLTEGFRDQGHEVGILTSGSGCRRAGRIAYLENARRRTLQTGWDVIQVIGPTPIFTEQFVFECARAHQPVVYTVNALPGLSTYYRFPGLNLVDRAYEAAVVRPALRQTSHLVFNTEEFARVWGPPEGKFSIIPYGIDNALLPTSRTEAGGWGQAHRPLPLVRRVLFVGQLRPYKGVDLILEAMKILRANGDSRTWLDVVGQGPAERSLRQLAERLHVHDRVRWLGPVPHEQLPPIYDAHDTLLLPSLCGESFGMVLVEARARGLLPIASDLPGVGQLVRLLGGSTFRSGDPSDLASKLSVTMKGPGPSRPGAAASDFIWKTVVDRYLDIYSRLGL